MSDQRHRVQADHSERDAPLLELLRQAGVFDVRMARLTVGDYLINDEVLIERKTLADFAASLVDGRLFPQAARLARDDHRSLMLIEGPPTTSMPFSRIEARTRSVKCSPAVGAATAPGEAAKTVW